MYSFKLRSYFSRFRLRAAPKPAQSQSRRSRAANTAPRCRAARCPFQSVQALGKCPEMLVLLKRNLLRHFRKLQISHFVRFLFSLIKTISCDTIKSCDCCADRIFFYCWGRQPGLPALLTCGPSRSGRFQRCGARAAVKRLRFAQVASYIESDPNYSAPLSPATRDGSATISLTRDCARLRIVMRSDSESAFHCGLAR